MSSSRHKALHRMNLESRCRARCSSNKAYCPTHFLYRRPQVGANRKLFGGKLHPSFEPRYFVSGQSSRFLLKNVISLPPERASVLCERAASTPASQTRRSLSAFSPSWLMAVLLFNSTKSSRPSKLSLALSHALLSSADHGAMSLPSTSSRRLFRASTIEIFNMRRSLLPGIKARHMPNMQGRNVMTFQGGCRKQWCWSQDCRRQFRQLCGARDRWEKLQLPYEAIWTFNADAAAEESTAPPVQQTAAG